jgi:hypothetical protein
MSLSDPITFRRRIAGAAMVAAPLVFVAAEVLHARFELDPEEQLAAVAENTGRWYAAHLLVLTALALVVPAFLGLARIVRPRRPVLAHVGLILFVPGVVALAAGVGMELVLWQMAQPAADRAEMVALAERVNESAGIAPVFVVLLCFPVAWLLAGIGLYAARAVPAWAAALVAVSQPFGFAVELAGGPKALAVAAQVLFALGLVPIGVRVLRQPDDEWADATAVAPATPAMT